MKVIRKVILTYSIGHMMFRNKICEYLINPNIFVTNKLMERCVGVVGKNTVGVAVIWKTGEDY